VTYFPQAMPRGKDFKSKGDSKMTTILKRLWKEEDGQDLVEYGLLVVLIALFAITSMSSLATSISAVFANAGTNLSST